MTLGTSRPRSWGKEAQQIALDMALKRARVAYQTRPVERVLGESRRYVLWLAPSHNGITLPFSFGSCADLVNVRRGRWEARHPFDGRVLATGVSMRDVVRAVIPAVTQ